MTVDWDFISSLEGSLVTKGYVPVNRKTGMVIGHSGVTIATGYDIGQHSPEQIREIPLEPEIQKRLLPYSLLQGKPAILALRRKPLNITLDEAKIIARHTKETTLAQIEQLYKRSTGKDFAELPDAAQTVVLSLGINFGTALDRSLPNTWATICRRDWVGLVEKLLSFPSKNKELASRREREGVYLRSFVNATIH